MTEQDCRRWAELADSTAIGEILTVEDRRFEQAHRRVCAICAAEQQIWSSLGQCLDSLDESARPSTSDFSLSPDGRMLSRQFTSRWWFVSAAIALIALTGATFAWHSSNNLGRRELTLANTLDERINLSLVAGNVSVGGAPASAGATLRPQDRLRVNRGRACLVYSWGVSTCLDEASSVQVLAPFKQERRVHLEAGKVVCRLDKQPKGTRFSVATKRGKVTAIGTVFAVEYLDNGDVVVRLHQGVVEVQSSFGEVSELRAPAALILSDRLIPSAPDQEAWSRDSELISGSHLWTDDAMAPLDIHTTPADAEVELDGISMGSAPLSMFLARGSHDLQIRRSGFESYQETIIIKGAQRLVRAPELLALADPNDSLPEDESVSSLAPSSSPLPQPRSSAAELLSQAQSLRRAGQASRAAQLYQQLQLSHPKSAEASAALLSLAELQLTRLNSPDAALRSFESYIAQGGRLAQEARYGRIQALTRLGRKADAQVAASDFLRQYPDSAQAASLRAKTEVR